MISEARREYLRRDRLKNPEKYKAAKIRWRKNNPTAYRAMKRRAAGLPEPSRPEPKLCELCGKPPTGRWPTMHLDHCHMTGIFRGWLCNNCNLGFGHFKHDVQLLRKAALYLEEVAK